MAIVINNDAQLTYQYNGAIKNTNSNSVSTTIIDQYGITGVKESLQGSFLPEGRISYMTTIKNTGSDSLFGVTVHDDLGEGLLSYEGDSIRAFLNGRRITPVVSAGTVLQVNINEPLTPNDELVIIYIARVKSTVPFSTNEITNTQTITAHEGSATGGLISVDPSPSVTITKEEYAYVTVTKSVDKEQIVSGDTLTYLFTLINTGNVPTTRSIITDELPEGFVIQTITKETDGILISYNPTEYSVDPATNTLTLPISSGRPIIVPAATETQVGKTIIKITGIMTI